MRGFKVVIMDDFLESPDAHVAEVLSGEFGEFKAGDQTFQGIQDRKGDIVEKTIGRKVKYNFARLSPRGQKEPNDIHSDEMMGDLIAILYLNKKHPEDGTRIYVDDEEAVALRMKYNRMVIFPAGMKHSRIRLDNFGTGLNSRLIQVLFL